MSPYRPDLTAAPYRPDLTAAPYRRRRRGTALAGGATALLAGAVLVLAVVTPSARPGLVSVTPADRATIAGPPSTVTLTFADEVDPERSHVTVATAGGADAAVGPSRVDGRRVLRPVRADTPGEYLVAYHVVLAGGGELSGLSRFTVPDPFGRDPSDDRIADRAEQVHAHDPLGPAALVPLAVVAVVVTGAVAGYWRARRRAVR